MNEDERLIRIGTRGSRLALWQAHDLQAKLQELGYESELVIIKTRGDRVQDRSFAQMEGKGFFTKEIETALLADEVDIAVHSLKDMPTTQPAGLVLAGVSERANPSDCLLIRPERVDAKQDFRLPVGAKVGTSSARRQAIMRHYRPDVDLVDLRGNVPTRVGRLRDGTYDAILLAKAGLDRLELDLSDLTVLTLHPAEFMPAPGQGVMTYQVKTERKDMRRLLLKVHQPKVAAATNVERKVLQLLSGGCQLPLGIHCEVDANDHYHVVAALGNEEDQTLKVVRHSSSTVFELAETIIQELKK